MSEDRNVQQPAIFLANMDTYLVLISSIVLFPHRWLRAAIRGNKIQHDRKKLNPKQLSIYKQHLSALRRA